MAEIRIKKAVMSDKYKLSISNGVSEYSEIFSDFKGVSKDNFYPVECSLSNIDDFRSLKHPIYGLLECLLQSDDCPSWANTISSLERNQIICKFKKI